MKKQYRNVAFLTELLINILVFSISCAILAQLFGQASLTIRDTRDSGNAGTELSALFETLRAKGPDALAQAGAEPAPDENGQSYLLGYDKSWNPTPLQDAAFTLRLTLREEAMSTGSLYHIDGVALRQNGDEVCRLSTAVYTPKGGLA